MNVSDILSRKGRHVITVTPETTIQDAIRTLVDHGVGSLLVVDEGGAIRGILTERDILRATAAHFDGLASFTVADLMSKDVLIAVGEDSIGYVERVMTEHRIRHLPILEGGKLSGLISIGDVVKWIAEKAEGEVRHLKDYISGSYPG